MVRLLKNEEWKPLPLKNKRFLRKKYAVSNRGRLVSYTEDIRSGTLLKGSTVEGYTVINVKPNDTYQSLYLHRVIAKLFVSKPDRRHRFVIHLNHDKKNNDARNLKWATKEEMEAHQQNSPAKKAYKERQRNRSEGLKLNTRKVKAIKRLLKNRGHRTMKQIAEKYGISEMQLYRIKKGENWGHVTA